MKFFSLWAVTTVLVVFFLYLPEKFKVFDKKLVHHRVESEECMVAKWIKSYVCVSKYRVIRLLKLLLPPISAVYKDHEMSNLTSNKVKRKRGNSSTF